MFLKRREYIALFLLRALVFFLQLFQCIRVHRVGELLAVEIHPVEVVIFVDCFRRAPGEIESLTTAFIGENRVGKGDLLEFVVGFVFGFRRGLVWF